MTRPKYDEGDNTKVKGPDLIALGGTHDSGQEDHNGKLRYRYTHDT